MKRINLIRVILCILFVFVSCGGPKTLVINTIHKDGSVTRKVVMTHDEDDFQISSLRVPIDSTWASEKTIEISEEGDTIWAMTAEKHFDSVDGINLSYDTDSSANNKLKREVVFSKKFKWFNTECRFSEIIRKAINGYDHSDFFTKDELHLLYMPDKVLDDLLSGQDSTRIMEMVPRLDSINEIWMIASYARSAYLKIMPVAEKITGASYDSDLGLQKAIDMAVILLNDEGEEEGEEDSDEKMAVEMLFGEGFYEQNAEIADSLLNISEEEFDVSLNCQGYSVQTLMPGELIGTNGYIDKEGSIMWGVEGDYFLSADYEMWAETKITNNWAWAVSIVFVIFVITGIIINWRKKKADHKGPPFYLIGN